ncbi:uncharacterized protein LOC128966772 [Homo sapiens]|uniref:uncharacterized protein LOC128966772 n=1 Tax=Homo sapiens TaxID=9606 RepID=UPI0023DFBAC2|nr:uncharacterized protein LOC128966772 [Homo sapiens]
MEFGNGFLTASSPTSLEHPSAHRCLQEDKYSARVISSRFLLRVLSGLPQPLLHHPGLRGHLAWPVFPRPSPSPPRSCSAFLGQGRRTVQSGRLHRPGQHRSAPLHTCPAPGKGVAWAWPAARPPMPALCLQRRRCQQEVPETAAQPAQTAGSHSPGSGGTSLPTQLCTPGLRTTSHCHVNPFPGQCVLGLEPNLLDSLGPSIFGVVGNLVAIVVLCKSRKEQKETTFYTVMRLAATDLFFTLLVSQVTIAMYMKGG